MLITSFERAEYLLTQPTVGIQNVISIGGLHSSPPKGFFRNGIRNRLRLEFDDIWLESQARIGYVPATLGQVQQIIHFSHRTQGETLIHCAQGIRRSAAAALILLAIKHGAGHEDEAVDEVVRVKYDIDPNKWMILVADHLLGRGDKLFTALQKRFPASTDGLLRLRAAA